MRDHQHETADTELAYRRERALLCRRVEMCSGLVQKEETRAPRSARRKQRASAMRWRSPAERSAPFCAIRRRGSMPSQAAFAIADVDFVVRGIGCAEPNVARDCVRQQRGPLRHPGNVAEPALAVGFGHRHAVHPTVPPDGSRKPSITLSNVDFPQPLGPTSATTSPCAARKRLAHSGERRCRRDGQ